MYMLPCESLIHIQVWHGETGEVIMVCKGIVTYEENILCLNLSQDNSRLVASNSAGLVMVSSLGPDHLFSFIGNSRLLSTQSRYTQAIARPD